MCLDVSETMLDVDVWFRDSECGLQTVYVVCRAVKVGSKSMTQDAVILMIGISLVTPGDFGTRVMLVWTSGELDSSMFPGTELM